MNTEGAGSAGAMAAVQEHLQDLRRLVFDRKFDETNQAINLKLKTQGP